ncbi:hypothetical protein GDO78_021251 [Eleutherodactylus coqui]|uniref:Uncharacterized protein n=1 Tax=Eleutherodactylus coqui TaxID=57060 RepID=A0A8J6EBP2_ELECQ|nr:hypothetical protein GDO78_021251 [Eleutherodactylus coqui]
MSPLQSTAPHRHDCPEALRRCRRCTPDGSSVSQEEHFFLRFEDLPPFTKQELISIDSSMCFSCCSLFIRRDYLYTVHLTSIW